MKWRLAVGLVTSTGVVGVAVTSGLALLANYFVGELSEPHKILDESVFNWKVPLFSEEPPPSQQRTLLFKTADDTLLCGDFWAQPEPAPTVILCHGYRASRLHLRSVAALLYYYGFNVLLFDFRGHGGSDSVTTSGGNAEVRDLEAALVVARRQAETLPGKIIIYGFSMGAAVALLTPPHPDVAAIIADSPYAHSDDILRRIIYYRLMQVCSRLPRSLHCCLPFLTWPTVLISSVVFRLRFGHAMVARPASSFKRWKIKAARAALRRPSIPILLVHAAGDNLIPITHARQIMAAAKAHNVPLETYFSDVGVHCGAYGVNPAQYVAVLLDFFDRHVHITF